MHAVFFEVRPKPGHLKHYFEHVGRLRPVLAHHTGLAFLDRYTALTDPDVLLSHQLWDSEDAICAWRADAVHRRSQEAGQRTHFADYRIRVGQRVLHWQNGVLTSLRETAQINTRYVVAFYGTRPIDAPDVLSFESVNRDGQFISLSSTHGLTAAEAALNNHNGEAGVEEAAVYSIRRDYGQFDRKEAPSHREVE